MRCNHFDAGTCRSCSLTPQPYERQLWQAEAIAYLSPVPGAGEIPTKRPRLDPQGFRTAQSSSSDPSPATGNSRTPTGAASTCPAAGNTGDQPRDARPQASLPGPDAYDVPTKRRELKNILTSPWAQANTS